MATKTKGTPKKGSKARRNWKPAFLKTLRETCNVSASCDAAGIGRSQAYRARKDDEAFVESWDEAEARGVDALVEEATKRARDGVPRPVFYEGEECGTVQHYSDTLAIFLLKSHRPDVYRETVRRELTGADGGPIEWSAVEEEDLVRKVEAMAANRARRAKAKPKSKPKARPKKKRAAKKKKGKARPRPRPMPV